MSEQNFYVERRQQKSRPNEFAHQLEFSVIFPDIHSHGIIPDKITKIVYYLNKGNYQYDTRTIFTVCEGKDKRYDRIDLEDLFSEDQINQILEVFDKKITDSKEDFFKTLKDNLKFLKNNI